MGRDKAADEEGFKKFEQFLGEWSRRDFLRRTGGAVAWTAFLAGGMELLEACGGGSSSQSSTQNVVKGGHLVEGQITDLANINPIFSNDVYSNTLGYRAYDALIDLDAQGNRIPALATAVPKVESDQLTYKVSMRKDAKWSDGQSITADDVVFTFSLMTDDKYKAVTSRYRSELTTYLDTVTAPDPYTVVFKTKKVYAKFIDSFIGLPFLPKHVWEKLDPATINSTPLNQLPEVVSGSFIPVKWDKGSQYVMKANPTYYKGKPHLDQWITKTVTDAVAIANQLKTGELDVGIYDASQHDALATATNIDRVTFVRPSYDYYIQNLDPAKTPKAAIFTDPAVRKALIMALNRKQIADKVYFGQAVAADSCMSAAQWAHVTPKTQYPFDAAKAAQLLDDAGWKKGSDGVRVKNGVRMEWELRTNVGNKVRETLIQVMADAWNSLGAKVTTNPIQFPQLVTQLSQTRQFEMILLGISESIDPDQTQLWASSSIGNGALNGMSYKNPQVDDLLTQGLGTIDRTKRKAIYAQVQEILMQDIPAPLVTFPKGLWGISKRVKNFGVGPWNQYGARPWFHTVYVVDGK